ncbi:MAG TPA: cell division protein ZipA C-terminal FtsZ-binding domain-containing protein [Steroidobacteraceae bacterium]
MSELRWTLLILGVVFIAALSWWERRRPRQAFAPRLREASLSHADLSHAEARRTASAEPAGAAEPWIGEAGLSDVVSSDVTFTHAADEPDVQSGLRAQDESAVPGPLEELPMLLIPDADECRAFEAAWTEQSPEPRLIDPESSAHAAVDSDADADADVDADDEPSLASVLPAEPPPPQATSQQQAVSQPPEPQSLAPEPLEPTEAVAASAPEPEIPGAEGVGPVRLVESGFDGDGSTPIEPIVDWPPENSRRILALRLVAPLPERFPGRTLRLALAAEGFHLGKFSIFHKPDEANRAVLSVASLNRPGAFDLETMDSQRYGGLSLFAVLPGPKRPPQAFEELLAAARNLNERLQGALQDERGGPLTQLRVSGIRESLRAEATIVPAAAAQ